MLKISEMRGDTMGHYHNALFLGDAAERVKVLEASGNINLAYICAKVHGLDEDAERIKAALEEAEKKVPEVDGTYTLLQPPTPINRGQNWPLLEVKRHTLENLNGVGDGDYTKVENDDFSGRGDDHAGDDGVGQSTSWGEDDIDLGDENDDNDEFEDGDGGWGDDDLDLGDDMPAPSGSPAKADENMNQGGDFFSPPSAGTSRTAAWISNSSHVADHTAAGSVDTAMQLLNRQIAASNFDAIKDKFVQSHLSSTYRVTGMPFTPPLKIHPTRKPGLPAATFTLDMGLSTLKSAYAFFKSGKFSESAAAFIGLLHMVPFIVVDTREEATQVKEVRERLP